MPIVDKNKYFSFSELKNYLEERGDVKSSKQYFSKSREGLLDTRCPGNPPEFYRGSSWPLKGGWGELLGTKIISYKERNFLTYSEVCQLNLLMEIRGMSQYKNFIRENKIMNLPLNPESYYLKSEGIRLKRSDFFAPKFVTLEQMVVELVEMGIKIEMQKDWQRFAKSNNNLRPSHIPSNPFTYYDITLKELRDMLEKVANEQKEIQLQTGIE